MQPILRTIRRIVPSVLGGLQAPVLASCEPVQPLPVQPNFSADSAQPRLTLTGAQVLTISAPDSSRTPGQIT